MADIVLKKQGIVDLPKFFMKFIRKVPLAISGLALGLASLGILLQPHGEAISFTLGAFSFLILCAVFIKIIFDLKRVKEELKNPLVLSTLPTFTMALMLLCVYAKPYVGIPAVYLWYLAVAAQILIMLVFAKRFIVGLKLETVFPSWFVVTVGIVTASVTSPAMDAKLLGQMIFYAGFVLYFIVLSINIYRLIKLRELPEPAQPTLAIFTAPMSLCIVGYFAAFPQPNALFVYVMLFIAAVSYIFVSVKMFSLVRLKFYPSFAAFTFPYVISAIAFELTNVFLVDNGYYFFSFMPIISKWIAIIVVAFVSVRYLQFLILPSPKAN